MQLTKRVWVRLCRPWNWDLNEWLELGRVVVARGCRKSRGCRWGEKDRPLLISDVCASWAAFPTSVHSGISCFLFPPLGAFGWFIWILGFQGVPSLCLDRHQMALIRWKLNHEECISSVFSWTAFVAWCCSGMWDLVFPVALYSPLADAIHRICSILKSHILN
jgi:hypothetical protein